MEDKRFCRLCDILTDLPRDVAEYADRLYQLLDEKDRADEDLIRKRLQICDACPRKAGDTCLSCGCYVLIRASAKSSRCPLRHWQKA